ncbi:MAG: ERF family protein [Lachnospiraceae bacterium]|nr:ERF family protein [Lachnospiraceae bacterium]
MEENNINIPKMRKFMSDQINEIAAALSAFQGSLKQPKLSKEVKVKTKTGGSYTFKYADLSACAEAAAPFLKENGLAVSQIISEWTLITLLTHTSGQWIKSELPISLNNGADYQALGSAITYIKRYSYCAILGIVADADDDANAACGNEAVVKDRKTSSTAVADTGAQQAIARLEQCKTKAEATNLWNELSKTTPALCSKGSEFYNAVATALQKLPEK